ncbi:hypothetical protein [Vibrio phage VP4B]|uniref:Uncharacterized protein n=1 Tax=Vibrio phage VP4B TaxID=1262540 RepID=V9LZY4_9CAUD|nr:hypothetical protein FDJ61_gp136 [Vibrio phage VP4B]AGB07250.1 hypothetical protein [Vibrio phage VP4B]
MEPKLKPVDLKRGEFLAKEMCVEDEEAKALFIVLYYQIRIRTRLSEPKALLVAYTTSEGVRLLGTGMTKQQTVTEMIAIPAKFVEEETVIVQIADLALDYFEALIGTAQELLNKSSEGTPA